MARIVDIRFPEAVPMALEALHAGKIIVLPTDTVYGVASLINEAAIEHIFAAKQRPPDRAVPVLLSEADAALLVARDFPNMAQRLAAAFWPGPLPLARPKRDDLPANLTQLPTVGGRVPADDLTRGILKAAGGALAVTSANRSDDPPACTIHDAIQALADRVALYLDGGPCPGGVPSTVVTFEGDQPRVLRGGPISESMLYDVLNHQNR
jgi:L-threonylcarbamoyladenylate synthase